MRNPAELAKILENLIKEPESEFIEFKANNHHQEMLGKSISAISNSTCLKEGKVGYLIYGIEDSTRSVVGTTFDPLIEKVGGMPYEHWLTQHINPKIDFEIHRFDYLGLNIVIFEIPPAIDRPIEFNGKAYIRVGSSTTELKNHPQKERKIWNNIQNKNFEKNLAIENLTPNQILILLDYAKFFNLTNLQLPTETIEFVDRLAQFKLVNKVLDNQYDISNLGAISLANELVDFPTVSRKSVRVIEYEGSTRENRKKEQLFDAGYAVIFEDLIDYIDDKLPYNEFINTALRTEQKMFPKVAIREFVANALIHQDLSITGTSPMIEIFEDRIEITNPGRPLIDVSRFIDHPPRSRNEDLAFFMRQVRICEEGGTGIDRALTQIGLYQLPAPKFETYDDNTRVTIFSYKNLKDMSLEDKVRACYQHAVLQHVQNKRMTNESLRERLQIDKSNYPAASLIIRESMERGFIKESDRSKEYIPFWA